MDWADEPATWKQLKHLRECGYQTNHQLTKTEAAALLGNFGRHPEPPATSPASGLSDATKHEALALRVAVEDAKRKVAEAEKGEVEKLQADVALAVIKREEYWLDTCRDIGRKLTGSVQAQDLYQRYGCRFAAPSHQDVRHILDALDSAAPDWERDHPELFYQTLELNFPHFLHRR